MTQMTPARATPAAIAEKKTISRQDAKYAKARLRRAEEEISIGLKKTSSGPQSQPDCGFTLRRAQGERQYGSRPENLRAPRTYWIFPTQGVALLERDARLVAFSGGSLCVSCRGFLPPPQALEICFICVVFSGPGQVEDASRGEAWMQLV